MGKLVCAFVTLSLLAREGFATTTKNHMGLLYKMARVEVKSRIAFLPQVKW